MALWFATLNSPESFQVCLVATRDYPNMHPSMRMDEICDRAVERRRIIAEAEAMARSAMVAWEGKMEVSRVHIERPGDTMHLVNRTNSD